MARFKVRVGGSQGPGDGENGCERQNGGQLFGAGKAFCSPVDPHM